MEERNRIDVVNRRNGGLEERFLEVYNAFMFVTKLTLVMVALILVTHNIIEIAYMSDESLSMIKKLGIMCVCLLIAAQVQAMI